MELIKKIIIPLILFIILMVFSVNNFDYKTFSAINDKTLFEEKSELKKTKPKEEAVKIVNVDEETEDAIPKIEEIEEIINKVNENIELTSNKPLTSIEVQKLINDVLSLNKINFERRSTEITKESEIVVEKIVKILKNNPIFKVEIAGHTDSIGAASLNKKISQDRASSVLEILVSRGINKDRLKAVGYGEDQPLVEDDSDGLSEINRRVEFNILGEE